MKKPMFVYVVEDIISGSTTLGGVEYTDNRFVRYAMQVYGDHALREYQVFKVAEYDGTEIKPVKREFIPWSIAQVKETRAENMSLVGATESEKVADFMDKVNS